MSSYSRAVQDSDGDKLYFIISSTNSVASLKPRLSSLGAAVSTTAGLEKARALKNRRSPNGAKV